MSMKHDPTPHPAPRGSELPADRLVGPAIFFVLGVALAILGIRGAPSPSELVPERGVAAPPPQWERFAPPAAADARGADWVVSPDLRTEEEPAPERTVGAAAPAIAPPTLSRGGGTCPSEEEPGTGPIPSLPGRSPPVPLPGL